MNARSLLLSSSSLPKLTVGLIAVLAAWASSPNASALNGTWNGSASALWSTATNWTTGDPGSNAGATASSTDTATFGASNTILNGTSISPVVIDANRNIAVISFGTQLNNSSATDSYVIGGTGSNNALYLTSGGSITAGQIQNQQTINAPLIIGASGSVATYTFNNSSNTESAGLNFGGTITGGGGVGSLTITLQGGSGGGGGNFNTISGVVSDGSVTDLTSIVLNEGGSYNQGGGNIWELSGNNTFSGGVTLTSGILVIGSNSALGTGTLTINPGGFARLSTDGAARTIANNILFSNAANGPIDFVGSGNLTVTGTTFLSTNGTTLLNQSTGTLSLGAVNLAPANTAGINTNLIGFGNTSITGVISDGAGTAAANTLTYGGTGTLRLSGHASSTGNWTLDAGTVVLDYSSDTGSKLGSGALTLGGVNLQLSSGNGTQSQATGGTSFSGGGQANISRTNGGTETLALGTVSNSTAGTTATAVNFQSGVATTTSTTTNSSNAAAGLINSTTFYTVGSQGAADWAATGAGGSIVGYSTVNSYATLASTPAGSNNTVNDSFSTTNAGSVFSLKITTDGSAGSTPTLTLGGNLTLTANGGILDSAASTNTYTISGSNIVLATTGVTNIQQYGNGALAINSNIIGAGSTIEKAGPGTLVLGGTNFWYGALAINSGAVSVASDSNLGGANGSVNVLTATAGSKTVTLVSAAPSTLAVGSSFLGGTVASVSGATVTLVANYAGTNITSSTASSYATAPAIDLNGGTLEASSSFSLSETNGTVTQNRAVNLGADGGTFQVDGASLLTVSGTISNSTASLPGSLTKTGTGTLLLTAANGYTGGTYINGGTLQTGIVNAISSSVLAGGITNPFVINGGTFDINGFAQRVGTLTLMNGTIKDSVGGANVQAASYNLQNGTVSAVMADFSPSSGIESNLLKSGTGTVVLSGANTFTGSTQINGGVLQVASADAGTGAGALGSTNVIDGAKGGISFGGGTLQYSSANAFDYSGRFVNSTSAISIDTNGRSVTYASGISISNTGGLTVADTNATPGSLTLTAANFYTGPTTVNSGMLLVSGSGKLGATTNALAVNGGSLDLHGTSQTVGVFSSTASTGTILNNGTGTSTLSVGNGTTSSQVGTYSGLIEDNGGSGGKVALTVTGSGTTTLSGANTYSGNTLVSSGGALLVGNTTGSALGTSALTVQKGATFGGSGLATGLSSFAIGSGGTGVATVQVGAGGTDTTSNLTLQATAASTISNANLTFNLSQSTPGQANQLVLNNGASATALTFGSGVSASTLTLNVVGGVIAPNTAYVLITDSNGFSGLNIAQGSNGIITSGLSIGGNAFFGANGTFTNGFYNGSYLFVTDNGTEIDVEVVPEPGTWAMMLGGLSVLLLWQRRKSKRT